MKWSPPRNTGQARRSTIRRLVSPQELFRLRPVHVETERSPGRAAPGCTTAGFDPLAGVDLDLPRPRWGRHGPGRRRLAVGPGSEAAPLPRGGRLVRHADDRNMPGSRVSTVPRGARMKVRIPDVRSCGPVRMGIAASASTRSRRSAAPGAGSGPACDERAPAGGVERGRGLDESIEPMG